MYIQFQANAHVDWKKWDILDGVLRTNLRISTLLASNIFIHILVTPFLACSFMMDVVQGMVQGIMQSGEGRTYTMLQDLFILTCW